MFSGPIAFSPYRPAAVLRVSGADAAVFLQGQFTQDIGDKRANLATWGLWLNQKGKVIADSHVLRDGVDWWIVSQRCPADRIRARLESYIIADEVEIEDQTGAWVGWVLLGSEAAAWIRMRAGELPRPGQWIPLDGGFLYAGRRGGDTWELLQRRASPAPAWAGGAEWTPGQLELRRLLAGVPAVPEDVGEGELPNEGGLEAEGISYSKGCYLGQEVMARLKTMGQVRRRLFRVEGEGPVPEGPCALFQSGKRVGELRSRVATEAPGRYVGLALLSTLALDTTRPLALEGESRETVRVVAAAGLGGDRPA